MQHFQCSSSSPPRSTPHRHRFVSCSAVAVAALRTVHNLLVVMSWSGFQFCQSICPTLPVPAFQKCLCSQITSSSTSYIKTLPSAHSTTSIPRPLLHISPSQVSIHLEPSHLSTHNIKASRRIVIHHGQGRYHLRTSHHSLFFPICCTPSAAQTRRGSLLKKNPHY